LLNWYACETFDNAFAGESGFKSSKYNIDLCKKYRNYSLFPGVNERNDCKLPDRFFLLFNQELSVAPKQEKKVEFSC